MPIGQGRVDGLMAAQEGRERIAIYWVEPAVFREAASFLRCCDLIFDGDVVHYWTHGMSQSGTYHLGAGGKDPLLRAQRSAESLLRSALGALSQIRCSHDATDVPLEVSAFFERSRGRTEYRFELLPRQAGPPLSATQLLNALPFGREYSKVTRADGSTVSGAGRPRRDTRLPA